MRRLLLLVLSGLCAAAVTTAAAAQSSSSAGATLFDEVWTTINDSSWDGSFGAVDWAALRTELRPKAVAALSADDARAVVNEMLARLKRSHFALLPATPTSGDEMVLNGNAELGIDFRIAGADVVITRRALAPDVMASRIAPGQRIVSIDGRLMAPRPGEPPLTSWRRVNAAVHGFAGVPATLVLRDVSGAEVTYRTPRFVPPGVRVQFSNLSPMRVRVDQQLVKSPAGRDVGVIEFNIWMAQINQPVANAFDRFRKNDGIVIDLRGNPGGLAAMISGIAGHFVDTPDLLGTMRTRQVAQLKFIVNPRTSTEDGRTVKPFAGPVAIIVDEMTASASECFAGALQDLGRVRVFGRTSMGAALPASTKRLANGDVLEYVVGDFLTSKGRSLEGGGVVPDEIQPLSITSLAAGKDDALAAALAWIDRQAGAIRR